MSARDRALQEPLTVFALSGAGCAAGSLALARLAEERGSRDGSEDVDEVGFTEGEARNLPGRGD